MRGDTLSDGGGCFLHRFIVTSATKRLVTLGLAEDDELVASDSAVRILSLTATTHTDGMNLGDVLGNGHQLGHGAERIAKKIHVETRDDDTNPVVGQLLAHIRKLIIEKLRLVDTDNIDIVGIK